MSKTWHYHLIAIVVVLLWGVTFVNSKVLLNHGLQAHEIFTLRFPMSAFGYSSPAGSSPSHGKTS